MRSWFTADMFLPQLTEPGFESAKVVDFPVVAFGGNDWKGLGLGCAKSAMITFHL